MAEVAEQEVVPKVDFEATPVQGQLGSAVLDLNGEVVRVSGLTSTSQASILYKMLLEVGVLPKEGLFKRLTVSFQSTGKRFSVARDETHVYVVQTQIS